MLYSLVEMNRAAMAPMRVAARASRAALSSPLNLMGQTDYGRSLSAMADVFESATRYYGKPEWRIDTVRINSAPIDVTPVVAWRSPWCNMIHFKKDPEALAAARNTEKLGPQPRLLIAAPLSGHYATLLRGTVEAFLPTHDVYITDWQDSRMAPVWLGRFDLDDYIDHIRSMLTHLGAGAHVLGVCQPGPPVLAAVAMMAEDDDPARPASMTFMGSPIDTRLSPTVPNVLAEEKPLSWFEENMIHTVPGPYPGMFRRVYPGFVQLASFMNMNWSRHVDAHWNFFNHLVEGDGDNVGKHREFYDEYLSVLDLLMTVEGENDDISGIGQTQAAHDLCVKLPEDMQTDYIQPGVGHYGVFNGRRFQTEIAPRVTEFTKRFTMRDADEAATERLRKTS